MTHQMRQATAGNEHPMHPMHPIRIRCASSDKTRDSFVTKDTSITLTSHKDSFVTKDTSIRNPWPMSGNQRPMNERQSISAPTNQLTIPGSQCAHVPHRNDTAKQHQRKTDDDHARHTMHDTGCTTQDAGHRVVVEILHHCVTRDLIASEAEAVAQGCIYVPSVPCFSDE